MKKSFITLQFFLMLGLFVTPVYGMFEENNDQDKKILNLPETTSNNEKKIVQELDTSKVEGKISEEKKENRKSLGIGIINHMKRLSNQKGSNRNSSNNTDFIEEKKPINPRNSRSKSLDRKSINVKETNLLGIFNNKNKTGEQIEETDHIIDIPDIEVENKETVDPEVMDKTVSRLCDMDYSEVVRLAKLYDKMDKRQQRKSRNFELLKGLMEGIDKSGEDEVDAGIVLKLIQDPMFLTVLKSHKENKNGLLELLNGYKENKNDLVELLSRHTKQNETLYNLRGTVEEVSKSQNSNKKTIVTQFLDTGRSCIIMIIVLAVVGLQITSLVKSSSSTTTVSNLNSSK